MTFPPPNGNQYYMGNYTDVLNHHGITPDLGYVTGNCYNNSWGCNSVFGTNVGTYSSMSNGEKWATFGLGALSTIANAVAVNKIHKRNTEVQSQALAYQNQAFQQAYQQQQSQQNMKSMMDMMMTMTMMNKFMDKA